MFSHPLRSMCSSRPRTVGTPGILNRLHAIPDQGQLVECTIKKKTKIELDPSETFQIT